MTLEETRKKWTDALAAFGASLEIVCLPETEEHRPRVEASSPVEERPCRFIVHNRERVSGAILVEMDEKRDEILAAFGGE